MKSEVERMAGKAARVIVCLLLFVLNAGGQEMEEPEQGLEGLAGRNNAEVLEAEPTMTSLEFFASHPLDLNRANKQELLQTGILNHSQVESLIRYRNLLGNFISVYEMQAVPGMDVRTLHKLLPYIIVSGTEKIAGDWRKARIRPENNLLIRVSRTFELSRGYREKDSSGRHYYPGSPEHVFIRYRYSVRNNFQVGFSAEKDAGEQFGRGAQRLGFDFYSFHCSYQFNGLVKQLILGDFTVNMGQGLIHWQNLAFAKSPDLAMLTRHSPLFRVYQSSGENQFHRGIALSLERKRLGLNLFMAYDGIDANLELDSIGSKHFSSIQSSGYHRTLSEQADRHTLKQRVLGGNFLVNWQNGHIGLNSIAYHFNDPIQRPPSPYNLFSLSGKSWFNGSVDYGFNLKQLRLFGEWAVDGRGGMGVLSGIMTSPDPSIDLGILYRHLGARFRSMEGNAFTESSDPSNENGLWMGITLRPVRALRVEAYADFFSFPWLKYRVDGPSKGMEYLLQTAFQPSRKVEIDFRFRWINKPGNDSLVSAIHGLIQERQVNVRSQFKYEISGEWTVRSRMEWVGYHSGSAKKEAGLMTNLDILFHPSRAHWSANTRLEWFETDGYESRIYAFENDVPYYYYLPALYHKGFRAYLNLKISYGSKFSMGLKWAQTLFRGTDLLGGGWDEIKGQKRSELRVELLINF